MRLVVQRVDGARVLVDGEVVGAIEGPGLCVLVGATHDDTPELAARLADKVYDMRLFDGVAEHRQVTAPPAPPTAPAEPADSPAPAGAGRPREVGAADLGLPVLVVSQFTLYGRTTKGRRPTWEDGGPGGDRRGRGAPSASACASAARPWPRAASARRCAWSWSTTGP